jgi:hypothetical protein
MLRGDYGFSLAHLAQQFLDSQGWLGNQQRRVRVFRLFRTSTTSSITEVSY